MHVQAIKDLRSLIGDHDLDHFFNDRDLICIIMKNDRDLDYYVCLKISITRKKFFFSKEKRHQIFG